MKIGVDLDEVLANFISPLLKYYNNLYDTNLTRDDVRSYNLWETFRGTKEDALRTVYDFYNTEHFRLLPRVEGSKEGVDSLSGKHELLVITSRPFDRTKQITFDWLHSQFPSKFLEVYFTSEWANYVKGIGKRKSQMCLDLGIDIMIEDSLEYAEDCADSGTNVFLLDYPWNKSNGLPDKIKRVSSWKEIVKEIENKTKRNI